MGRGCWAEGVKPDHCSTSQLPLQQRLHTAAQSQAALGRAERGTGFCTSSFFNLNQGKVFFLLPFIPP